jgi:hypothetical protein
MVVVSCITIFVPDHVLAIEKLTTKTNVDQLSIENTHVVTRETSYLKLNAELTDWWPKTVRLLNQSHKRLIQGFAEGAELKLATTLTNLREEMFLVTVWSFKHEYDDGPFVYFHRLKFSKSGDPELEFLFHFGGMYSMLVSPSGITLSPGEGPVAVVSSWGGGNSYFANDISIIPMGGDLTRDLPSWAGHVRNLDDLDNNGNMELVTMNGYWGDYVPECEDCRIHVVEVLTRRNKTWVSACKEFGTSFQDYLKMSKAFLKRILAKNGNGKIVWQKEVLANLALAYAQIGDHEEAKKYASRLVQVTGNNDHPLVSFLQKAKSLDHLQCPVSAARSDDPRWHVK